MVVVGAVILVGGYLVFANGLTFNWTPANDAGIKSFMPNGFSGVMAAVAGVFFAYIGFDAVSVLAEESKNPQRDLPRGMIYSLVICTIVYILLTLVLTGAVNYRNFESVGDPLAFIFEKQNLNVGWMQLLVAICAVVAMTSVLLVFQMGQPRIWMSMSRDGLLPPVFQKIHPTFKTPSFATIVTGFVVGVPILFTDKIFVLDFTSIATLFAFVLVCGGVLLIPRKEKQAGKFNIPYVNGKIIFPLLVVGSIAVLSFLAPKYFTHKLNFNDENKVDAFASIIPTTKFDTVAVIHSMEENLSTINSKDELFKGLLDSMNIKTTIEHKMAVANKFISSANTEQSRTQKVSTVIFWLLMIGIAVITVLKNYSLIPLMGVTTCLYLLTGMTKANWLWFGGWLVIGLVIYFLYGYKKSKLAA
jgi:amino acid transporter